MAGTWVRTGTVTVTNGSKKVAGNGTSWLSNLLQKVGKGCMCVIDNVISEVDYVNSDTELYLVEAWEGATASGKKYKIQVTVTDTIPELSSRISQSLAYANGQYGNLESWSTGSAAVVTLTSPAGTQVAVPNLSALNSGPLGPVEFDLRSPAQLLRWRHYGTGHTIFDASKGKSPADTDINNINATVPWMATYPTLMGWNGVSTYGVRVDSARVADAANAATDLRGGLIRTNGHDLVINDKRALVGFGASEGNNLVINYAGDFDSVSIQSQLLTEMIESNRHVAAKNGATAYNNGQLEAKTTDGTDVIIGLHRAGYSAAAIRHNGWGVIFEREGGAGTYSNVAGANFFANAAQDGSANALTRKDYVDTVANNSRWDNSRVIAHSGGDANAHYNSTWDGNNVANAPSSGWHFFREMYHSGGDNWRHQEAFDFFNNEEYFRRGMGSASNDQWMRRWNSSNYNVTSGFFTPLLVVVDVGEMAVDGNSGFWHRNGNTVTGHGLVFVSDHADFESPLRIAALPFVPNNAQFATIPVAIYGSSVNARSVFGSLNPNNNFIDIMCVDMNGVVRNLKGADITNEANPYIRFSFTYYCA